VIEKLLKKIHGILVWDGEVEREFECECDDGFDDLNDFLKIEIKRIFQFKMKKKIKKYFDKL
jgi:hypothetical protein